MPERRRISYFSLTSGGSLLALKLKDRFGGEAYLPRSQSLGCQHCSPFDNISEVLPGRFMAGDSIICVMAAGIVFRVLGPLLKSKQEDPAVIVVDEGGRFVVPLLGGHAAGANDLAREMAAFLGGEAVLTTSSDAQGLIAPGEVARRMGAAVGDPVALRRVTALLVDGKPVCIEAPEDPGIEGYAWVEPGGSLEGYQGRLLVTCTAGPVRGGIPTAKLVPRLVSAGVGCCRGAGAREIITAVDILCNRHGIDMRSVAAVASIEAKNGETGLAEAASELGAGLKFFTAAELGSLERSGSDFVASQVGTPAVSEPAALLAAGEEAELIAGKTVFDRITVALAVKQFRVQSSGLKTVPGSELKPGRGNCS